MSLGKPQSGLDFPENWLKTEDDDGLRDFMYPDEYRLRDLQQNPEGTKR